MASDPPVALFNHLEITFQSASLYSFPFSLNIWPPKKFSLKPKSAKGFRAVGTPFLTMLEVKSLLLEKLIGENAPKKERPKKPVVCPVVFLPDPKS